jgi:dienelactone hydrolase
MVVAALAAVAACATPVEAHMQSKGPSAISEEGATRDVRFDSAGTSLVGRLYLPAGSARAPAIVVVPPWLNVKEQVATNYAKALAKRGFVALAFDFRYWGESGGQPREWESPSAKVVDLKAAVAFMSQQPEVLAGQVGVLGVCFGAGYAMQASIEDPAIRSLATVAAWLHDARSLEMTFGAAEIDRRRRVGQAALESFTRHGRVDYVAAASGTDKTAAMFGLDYYLAPDRGGARQEWTNRMATMSWPGWLDFDAVALGARVTAPLLMVHSDGSALPDNARKVYAAARGPKELLWLEGNHTDFYDRTPYVERASDAVAMHFAKTLSAERTDGRSGHGSAADR